MSLRNRTVLITRQVEQSREFIAEVERRGGRALVIPMIRIADPDSWDECDRAIDSLSSFDGLIFTSTNAVERFFGRCEARNAAVESLAGNVVAVGSRTARALKEKGISVRFVPEKYTSETLGEYFTEERIKGKRFLFPRGNLSPEHLGTHIAKHGGIVKAVTVYTTVGPDQSSSETLIRHLHNHDIDVVTFASPSAAKNFVSVIGKELVGRLKSLTAVAAIGPTTASAASELGMIPDIIAMESTVYGLADAITTYFQ